MASGAQSDEFNPQTDGLMNFYDTHSDFVQICRGPSCRTLRIPTTFTKDFLIPMPRHVTISTSDHSIWNIALIFCDGTAHFSMGWREFSQQYGITTADIIHAAYDKDSHFRLSIFSVNGDKKRIHSPSDNPNYQRYHHFVPSYEWLNLTDSDEEGEQADNPDGPEAVGRADTASEMGELISLIEVKPGVNYSLGWELQDPTCFPVPPADSDDDVPDKKNTPGESSVPNSAATKSSKEKVFTPMSVQEKITVYFPYLPHTFIPVLNSCLAPRYHLVLPSEFSRASLQLGKQKKTLRLRWFGTWPITVVCDHKFSYIKKGWREFVEALSITTLDSLYLDQNAKDQDVWNVTLRRALPEV